ncbi:MAG: molybdopterin-dependent oxidoreductase [SAR324 cluster bacterium]
MLDRRRFIVGLTGGLALLGSGVLPGLKAWAQGNDSLANPLGPPTLPGGTLDSALLEALPGKRPLIKRSYRPPNYETPVAYLNEMFTPNDAFFVRYHQANIPQVNADAWRLSVKGDAAERPFELTFDRLRKEFEPVELVAVNQCSGNRRGLSQPHVPGVEWGFGAMGNARWKGARLKDILAKAGVKKDALEVAYDGADTPALATTPDFQKTLPIWKALDENTLVAYEMNGQALPHWNGYPARLIAPGWTGTYWMKHLVTLQVISQPFKNWWVNTAYRIPIGKFPVVDRFISQESETSTPITEMVVNSLITAVSPGAAVRVGDPVQVQGIAWDGGYGIQTVEVSVDGGQVWRLAALGKDYGRFSWRQWSYAFRPEAKGTATVLAKATNRIGATQTFDLIFNPAGYHNNLVSQTSLTVA